MRFNDLLKAMSEHSLKIPSYLETKYYIDFVQTQNRIVSTELVTQALKIVKNKDTVC